MPDTYDVITIDKLGILAEVYAFCDLAFIGGAMHYQVHNVLEPLPYMIPIAFGPLHSNSREARDLVRVEIARVIKTPKELLDWLSQYDKSQDHLHQKINHYLNENRNSSKLIFDKIRKHIEDPGDHLGA